MQETLEVITSVGASDTGVAGATAIIDIEGGDNYRASFKRRGMLVAATGAAPVYIKLVNKDATAPTVTASNYAFKINPGQTLIIKAKRSLDLYIFGTTAFFFQEVS